VILCASNEQSNSLETLNTFRFGSSVSTVQNKPQKVVVLNTEAMQRQLVDTKKAQDQVSTELRASNLDNASLKSMLMQIMGLLSETQKQALLKDHTLNGCTAIRTISGQKKGGWGQISF